MTAASDGIRPRALGTWLVLLALPGALFPGVVAEAVGLHALADGPRPYLVISHAWLLYLAVPAVVVSSVILFLAPGLCLTARHTASASVPSWLLRGFAVSFLVAMLLGTIVSATWGAGLSGRGFGVVTLLVAAVAAFWADRQHSGANTTVPLGTPEGRWSLILMLGVVAALTALLVPKLLWEDFNGDGAHAFLSSRLLLEQRWPFWRGEVGALASFPGVTSMLFSWPNAWFLRLLGEVEASVRIPFLLYLPILAAALVAVAQHERAPLERVAWFALWTGLIAYLLAMAFSATYNPYHADLALPATQDTLLMICVVGWIHAMVRGDWAWALLFGVGCAFSLPSGMLLMAMWLGAHLVVTRPLPVRTLAAGAVVLACCVVVVAVLPAVLAVLGAPEPGTEYGSGALRRYFELLQFTDWRRLAYFVVPAGLFPGLVLLWWRGQDGVARGITLLTLLYFGLFFIQAHVTLHHFVPAMLLPVIVAARSVPPAGNSRRVYLGAWQVLAALAVVLSLPRSLAPHTTARKTGAVVSQLVGAYPRDAEVLAAGSLLGELVPPDWDLRVPESSYGGSPLVWLHYARHGALEDGTRAVLARVGAPVPPAMEVLASTGEAILYIRDESVVPSLRAARPPPNVGSAIYEVPRGIIWRGHPLPGGPRIIPAVDILGRLRALLGGSGG